MISDFEVEVALNVAAVRGELLHQSEKARKHGMYQYSRFAAAMYEQLSWELCWHVHFVNAGVTKMRHVLREECDEI